MPPGEEVVHDYGRYPLAQSASGELHAPSPDGRGTLRCAELGNAPHGRIVEVAGWCWCASGRAPRAVISTLEDETGIANVVIWSKVFEKNRRVVLGSRLMAVRGEVQREGLVIHVIARSFVDMTGELIVLAEGNDIGDSALQPSDEGRSGRTDPRADAERRRQAAADRTARAALPAGRNFH